MNSAKQRIWSGEMEDERNPAPVTHVTGEPTAWLTKIYSNDGTLIDTQLDFVKPRIGSTAKTEYVPLYPSPVSNLDLETAAAIALGASVLTRIEDPAVREIAIRNALTAAAQTPSHQTHLRGSEADE